MADNEKVIKGLEYCGKGCNSDCPYWEQFGFGDGGCLSVMRKDALALLKEQGKKEIKLHKKHVITWKRDDEFTTRKLYEAVCETLMDEGELVIVRIDDHEKVDFTFYVTHEDT